jgi:hypothetical protein
MQEWTEPRHQSRRRAASGWGPALLCALVVFTGCGGMSEQSKSGATDAPAATEAARRASGPQRITAAIRGEMRNLGVMQSLPGGPEVRELMQSARSPGQRMVRAWGTAT